MMNVLSSRTVDVLGSPVTPFQSARARVASVLVVGNSRLRLMHVDTVKEQHQQQRVDETVDDKIQRAQHKFEEYFDDLLHFLSQQDGVDPRKLESIKATMSADPTTTATLLDEGCGFVHYSKSCVSALQQVQNQRDIAVSAFRGTYINDSCSNKENKVTSFSNRCPTTTATTATTNTTTTKRKNTDLQELLLLSATWESLARYLQLIQKRLDCHYRKFLQQQQQQQLTRRYQKVVLPRRIVLSMTPSCGVTQSTIAKVSEIVATCLKECILIHRQKVKAGISLDHTSL